MRFMGNTQSESVTFRIRLVIAAGLMIHTETLPTMVHATQSPMQSTLDFAPWQ